MFFFIIIIEELCFSLNPCIIKKIYTWIQSNSHYLTWWKFIYVELYVLERYERVENKKLNFKRIQMNKIFWVFFLFSGGVFVDCVELLTYLEPRCWKWILHNSWTDPGWRNFDFLLWFVICDSLLFGVNVEIVLMDPTLIFKSLDEFLKPL